MASEAVQEERFEFTSSAKTKIYLLGITGLVLFAIGVFMAMSGGGHEEGGHASAAATEQMVASLDQHAEAAAEEGAHQGTPTWLKRIYTSLWQNNVFFAGIGIIGLFFVAIQYAAQAGWSAGVKRIPLAMGTWIPIAGVIMLVVYFIASHDLFHWTHSYLYEEGTKDFDPILDGKGAYFFLPFFDGNGGFPVFWVFRLVLFFSLWYLFYVWIRREMLAEDIDGGTDHWSKARRLSAVFLIIFAVSSSVSAWDWVMSIEPHWFSTMMGWYVFASWWVTGLAVITLIVANLKEAGYLKVVNSNHLHDLGKFVFAFSIFWTYIWFSQFMLIYYANIPEETVYFIARMKTAPYSWIFFLNLILNFFLPFLLFMTRDAKRHLSTLKLVCPIVIVGHWFDFYNMITPGVMKTEGGFGLLEIGLALVFAAAFIFVTLNALTKFPLVPKNDPMMAESLHHHI
jgi:hypothetical protein